MTRRAIPLLAALLLVAAPAWAKPAKHAKAAKTPPLTVAYLLGQSQAAMDKGDTALALRMAQAAVVAGPAQPTTYVALGDIYAATGEGDYARSYYDEALQIDPAAPSALKAIAALDGRRPGATAQAGP